MSLIATARPSRVAWLIGYVVLCGCFGIWGAYDYWVRIPEQDRAFAEFLEVQVAKQELEAKSQRGPLTQSENDEYQRLKERYADGNPAPVPVYDRPLQLWVYVVGCGVLGTPWFVWSLMKLKRRRVELSDSGDLTVDGTTLARASISGIDMSRWMSKSIAEVIGANGERLAVDDYLIKDAHLIIGRIAHQFHPGEWNEDATKVKPPEESDPGADGPLDESKASS